MDLVGGLWKVDIYNCVKVTLGSNNDESIEDSDSNDSMESSTSSDTRFNSVIQNTLLGNPS